jgi:CBS domain containing-hemolysin-like protein
MAGLELLAALGITAASLGLGVVGGPAFEELLEPILGDGARVGRSALAGLFALLLITVLHLVVGELSPQSLAIARTERSALLVAPSMRVFSTVTNPLVTSSTGSATFCCARSVSRRRARPGTRRTPRTSCAA